MKGLRLIPEDTHIDFIGHRFFAYALSLVVVFGSLFLVFTKGLNFGIDFTGGTLIEIRVEQAPDLADLRGNLNSLSLGGISLQEFGEPTDLLIRLPEQPGGEEAQKAAIEKVRVALDEKFENVDYRRTEFVGPQVGKELKKKGLYAVLFSMLGILAYIWLRFEWQFGLAAIAALLHDVIGTVGLFALTGMSFDLSSLAAVLMIAGYSINDTVVIFDRIRETLRKYKKKPLPEILNRSINDTLSRTIVTGLTTLLALVALWAFGGEVVRSFVNALIFGVVIGTHSSIFVAAPLLLYLNIRKAGPEETSES
ncbi:MAG: protein translocase subunit SecF [Rhodospirillales bacterium]|nr:protein translocase subunit SecF [Alphaproteobacteria bacterium]USO03557.1 MAG: protein translocase subunit SecF [Rhodospirillales bacterium]